MSSEQPFEKEKADESDTPAAPDEQIDGSDQPEDASASTVEEAKRLEYSDEIESALRDKIDQYQSRCNNRYGRVEMGELKAVLSRAMGAYSSTHQPDVDRVEWGLARVRSYLNLRCTGSPVNPNYTQDNDLLPSGHPESTKGDK